jgi:hypothetical protein
MSVREEWVIDGYLLEICQSICTNVKSEFPEASFKILRAAYGYYHCTLFNEQTNKKVLTFQLFRNKLCIDPVPEGYPGEYAVAVLEDPEGAELLSAFVLDNYLALA